MTAFAYPPLYCWQLHCQLLLVRRLVLPSRQTL